MTAQNPKDMQNEIERICGLINDTIFMNYERMKSKKQFESFFKTIRDFIDDAEKGYKVILLK